MTVVKAVSNRAEVKGRFFRGEIIGVAFDEPSVGIPYDYFDGFHVNLPTSV